LALNEVKLSNCVFGEKLIHFLVVDVDVDVDVVVVIVNVVNNYMNSCVNHSELSIMYMI
jgi:hypothetical protein